MPTSDQAIDAFRAQATPQPASVRVAVVQDAEATGETAELYDQLRDAFFGFVPDVFKLVSARPDMLRVLVDGHTSMFAVGDLPREVKEVIALTVARTASCQYCASAHDTLLRLLGTDTQFADAVASGALDHPSIGPEIRALAELARDITQHAYRVTEQQISAARALGWTEAQVLEAIWVACSFNTFVRLADALGLYELGQLTAPSPTPDRPSSQEKTSMPASNADAPATGAASVVAEFLAAYLSGDLDRARSLVSDDFAFQAPLIEQHATKEDFFGGAEQKVALIEGHRILRRWADGEEVSTVYEIDVRTDGGAASMRLHEWHTVRDARLVSTVMTFDTAAPAALLMHQALMSPHA